ncbi:hypothetical protein WK03_17745 [Burkholderia cepacia]|nr:hypothetical protein WK03_17745 [Burkholderia cepacia]
MCAAGCASRSCGSHETGACCNRSACANGCGARSCAHRAPRTAHRARPTADGRPAHDPLAWFDTLVVPVYVAGRALGRRIDAMLERLPWARWGGWLDARANGVGRRRWLAPLLLVADAVLWAEAVSSPSI